MSVISNKRDPNILRVLGMARGLAIYCQSITRNERYFPKRSRWQIAREILQAGYHIHEYIRRANAIECKTYADYTRRMTLQKQALEEIDLLLGLIDLVPELPADKQEYWTGLVMDLDGKCRAWHRANARALMPGGANGLVLTDKTETLIRKNCESLARALMCLQSEHGPAAV